MAPAVSAGPIVDQHIILIVTDRLVVIDGVDLGASAELVEQSQEAGHWSISLLAEPRHAFLVEQSQEAVLGSISLWADPAGKQILLI